MDFSSISEFSQRDLPYSLEAEQTVLGALLLEPETLSIVMEHLKPESFYNEKHRDLFGIIIRMFSSGTNADIITVLNEAVKQGIFESSSQGKSYLSTIMQGVPTVSNIESYCKIVEEKFYIRSLILAAREIIDIASSGQDDAKTILDSAEQKIYDIRQGREVEGLTKIDEVIVQAYDRLQKITGPDKEKYLGAKSGFAELDTVITGLNKSDLLIIAARPGMGKTSFAMNIATNVARRSGKQVAVFSLEMSKEQLAVRMLSSEALVSSQSLKTGKISGEEWVRLAAGADVLSRLPIYLDDTPGITVPQMKAKLRRMSNLGLVVIDYLQLMSSARRIDNRVLEISEITRHLKLMAKELNVPVITLSQLSRGPESRTDHRPLLSDLRESGSIEQDADIIMFLYRDAYYNKESEQQNISECIIAKNRHGSTGTVYLVWDGQFTRFSSAEVPK
ncbi:MAG: primary replicative helicase [Oscillospiraceae bacterium]|jgi:replicative DNA helicase|nr:primary replicative helicase [Oscillospiraceae bacterium]